MRHKTEISNPLRKVRKSYQIIELVQTAVIIDDVMPRKAELFLFIVSP
jgi:hypothetical protein